MNGENHANQPGGFNHVKLSKWWSTIKELTLMPHNYSQSEIFTTSILVKYFGGNYCQHWLGPYHQITSVAIAGSNGGLGNEIKNIYFVWITKTLQYIQWSSIRRSDYQASHADRRMSTACWSRIKNEFIQTLKPVPALFVYGDGKGRGNCWPPKFKSPVGCPRLSSIHTVLSRLMESQWRTRQLPCTTRGLWGTKACQYPVSKSSDWARSKVLPPEKRSYFNR